MCIEMTYFLVLKSKIIVYSAHREKKWYTCAETYWKHKPLILPHAWLKCHAREHQTAIKKAHYFIFRRIHKKNDHSSQETTAVDVHLCEVTDKTNRMVGLIHLIQHSGLNARETQRDEEKKEGKKRKICLLHGMVWVVSRAQFRSTILFFFCPVVVGDTQKGQTQCQQTLEI